MKIAVSIPDELFSKACGTRPKTKLRLILDGIDIVLGGDLLS